MNDGETLWVLGLKTEGGGTLLETRSGVTRKMTAADPRWAGYLTLLTAGTSVHIPIRSLGAPPE